MISIYYIVKENKNHKALRTSPRREAANVGSAVGDDAAGVGTMKKGIHLAIIQYTKTL
jgi:hypothetical protein